MEGKSESILSQPGWLLVAGAVVLFVGFIFVTFLHEDGHGVGAKLDGIHISTGFNKVGNYGKSPDQPDFRSDAAQGGFWAGLLGPVTSWILAAVFTIWLYRFKAPTWGALGVGALAVASSLVRAVPMTLVLVSSLLGRPYMEDEVQWGVWYVLKCERPELLNGPVGLHALLQADPRFFLSFPAFWIGPLLSLTISLVFLVLAYPRLRRLWGGILPTATHRWLFGLMPLAVYVAKTPALNWLDRLIRINW